jgi:hypothetical protein
MLAPIDRPVICPVMIGREPNLALLDDILAATSRGEGQTVLLAGEAGVGKLRMVSEARARVAVRYGLLILQDALHSKPWQCAPLYSCRTGG